MAQPGVSIQMNFAREITRATAMIQATPKQLELASRRAIKKTIRWLQTRVARELAQALSVPQKALKHRLTVSEVGSGGDQVHILWLGVAPLAAEAAGRPRQTQQGVSVGRRKYPGAFYKDVYGDGPGTWIRKSRAAALGLSLPQWRRANKGAGNGRFLELGGPGDTSARGRFPVMRVGIDIEAVAREIFRRYDKRAIERFSTLIDQELNYAVNHEQKRK